MSYVFAPSYLTLRDDWGENRAGAANTTALAGMAILSRSRSGAPRTSICRRCATSSRRRSAGWATSARCWSRSPRPPGRCWWAPATWIRTRRRASARYSSARCSTRMPGGAPRAGGRRLQLVDARSVVGARQRARRRAQAAHRGLRRSIDGYMRPAACGEQPLFDVLAARGFTIDGFNDDQPTYRYDFNDPYALQKLRRAGGPPLVALIRWLLRRWNRCLPARLDWFAGRATRAISATVVAPRASDGRAVSDHAAVVCDLGAAAERRATRLARSARPLTNPHKIRPLTNLSGSLSRLRERVRERADLATVAPDGTSAEIPPSNPPTGPARVGSRKACPLPNPLRRRERGPDTLSVQ